MVEQNTRRMRCGCGFELVGDDATIEVFNEHICTDNEPPVRWHQSVFSFDGFIIALALGSAIALIVGVLVGAK